MIVGRLTISDRASQGLYEDLGGPAIEKALQETLGGDIRFVASMVPDETDRIIQELCRFTDELKCHLVVTTGGTGISPRDLTPEATRRILHKELPGFGEIMRIHFFAKVPTSILSRAVAGTRGESLIINLPGKPSAVRECLSILAPAIREGLDHLRGLDPHLGAP